MTAGTGRPRSFSLIDAMNSPWRPLALVRLRGTPARWSPQGHQDPLPACSPPWPNQARTD